MANAKLLHSLKRLCHEMNIFKGLRNQNYYFMYERSDSFHNVWPFCGENKKQSFCRVLLKHLLNL
jgi:hypothetical protein